MANLVCPHCGAYTAPNPNVFKATVTYTQPAGLGTTVRRHEGLAEAVSFDRAGRRNYGVMVCLACDRFFVAKLSGGEWLAVYPIQHKVAAEDIPEPVRSDFDEANLCLAVGAYKGTLAMCQATMEALWRDKKATGLNDLRDGGIISEQLFLQATEIRLWAGIVKHELLPDAVGKEDAEQLLTYLEGILDAVYVQPARIAAIAQKRKQIKKGDTAA